MPYFLPDLVPNQADGSEHKQAAKSSPGVALMGYKGLCNAVPTVARLCVGQCACMQAATGVTVDGHAWSVFLVGPGSPLPAMQLRHRNNQCD